MTKKQQNGQEAPDAQSGVQFMIQRLYVKDLSFEAPHTPQIFQKNWEPELSLEVNVTHQLLEGDAYEVVLRVTASVKNAGTVAFLIEVQQAGIFTIQGVEAAQLRHLLESFCPQMLFPYAREVITSEVVRGSFPPLVLAPINFDALYYQKLAEDEAKEETGAH